MDKEQERYSIYMDPDELIRLLKEDDEENECIIDIEVIRLDYGGKIYIEGKQKKIIDGVIIS